MSNIQKTLSPVDGSVYVERALAEAAHIEQTLAAAHQAQQPWAAMSIPERAALLHRWVDCLLAHREEILPELSWQMGRPLAAAPAELGGFEERARHMLDIAGDALADLQVGVKPGFQRFIRRVPLGVVFTVAPWNYPYLTAVNSIVPALMAGNTVILKHSAQTPLCAERLDQAALEAGLPEGVFQILHLSHDDTARVIADGRIGFVAFTGSVAGGRAVQAAAAGRFIGQGLELGGKDPAYVRHDADLAHAVENLTDGAFFNSGQSCCGIERIYVHRSLYERFVEGMVETVKQYRLGNPLDPDTNLGPMVRTSAATLVRQHIAEAVSRGARALIEPSGFPAHRVDSPYQAPQVLVDVDHGMQVMREESFGPVVGIMAVDSDAQAVDLMNDSDFGLTACVWSRDEAAAIQIGDALHTGTVFMNRCDYLDPALAWVGVKHSGRGCTLSRVGYEHLTRAKSFHLRTAT